jgi:hypothetical protein
MKRYNQKDPSHYYDENGEQLDPELFKVQELEEDDVLLEDGSKGIIISYKEFAVISGAAIDYINKHFTSNEVGKISSFPMMLKTKHPNEPTLNILYKSQRTMHDKKTLQSDLGLGKSQFNDFFRKLLLKNIIFYGKTGINEVMTNVIMLNPFYAKRTMRKHKYLNEVFKPLRLKRPEKPVTSKP